MNSSWRKATNMGDVQTELQSTVQGCYTFCGCEKRTLRTSTMLQHVLRMSKRTIQSKHLANWVESIICHTLLTSLRLFFNQTKIKLIFHLLDHNYKCFTRSYTNINVHSKNKGVTFTPFRSNVHSKAFHLLGSDLKME